MIMVSVIIYFGKQTLISPCWGSHARESIPEPPRTSKVRPWSPPIHLNWLRTFPQLMNFPWLFTTYRRNSKPSCLTSRPHSICSHLILEIPAFQPDWSLCWHLHTSCWPVYPISLFTEVFAPDTMVDKQYEGIKELVST